MNSDKEVQAIVKIIYSVKFSIVYYIEEEIKQKFFYRYVDLAYPLQELEQNIENINYCIEEYLVAKKPKNQRVLRGML